MQCIIREAQNCADTGKRISIRTAETEAAGTTGPAKKETIRSALLALEGEDAAVFAEAWTGTIQWIWQSTYRPQHKRKNWFIGITRLHALKTTEPFSVNDVRFETMRSSGNGGQKINKMETAVRAVHIPTGKSALAREERSQLLNKKLALARLALLFEQERINSEQEARSRTRHSHYELERGNPVRIFAVYGDSIKEIPSSKNKGTTKQENYVKE
jgi:peptide chain release factor